jgi:hypothetical protein
MPEIVAGCSMRSNADGVWLSDGASVTCTVWACES